MFYIYMWKQFSNGSCSSDLYIYYNHRVLTTCKMGMCKIIKIFYTIRLEMTSCIIKGLDTITQSRENYNFFIIIVCLSHKYNNIRIIHRYLFEQVNKQ